MKAMCYSFGVIDVLLALVNVPFFWNPVNVAVCLFCSCVAYWQFDQGRKS